jgi:zinc protease
MTRAMRRVARLAVVAGLAVAAGSSVLTAQQSQEWPTSRAPSPLPSHPVSFPPYQLKSLANGLQVLVIAQHEEPSVSFRLLIRVGGAQDPADKPGVASLVADLLDQGTTTKSSEQIADAIESAGGMLDVGAGDELSFVNAGVVRDRFDQLLDVASDIVQHPAFSPSEIDRQRQQALSGMQVNYDDPEYIAHMVFDRVVYGFHPYGKPTSGTPESIARITRDDLVTFHHTWFVPNNAILAIVGDVTTDEAVAAAERAFGTWTRRELPVITLADPPSPTRRVVVIDKPGAVQTEIRVGHLGVSRTDADYLPLDLAIRILGGEGANRLFGVLRTERGLTYGASAEMQALKSSGAFVAQTNTRSSATGEVLRLMVDEFARLQRERVDPRELHGAQDYVSGGFPLTIETPRQIALLVLNQLFYGMGLKDLDTYGDRVDGITVEDILRVSRDHLRPDRLTIVLVGDASAFLDQLKAQGFGDYERIALTDLDLNSPDLKKAKRGPHVPGRR